MTTSKTEPTTIASTGLTSTTQAGRKGTTAQLTLGQRLVKEYESLSFQNGEERLQWLASTCNHMLHEMARSRHADRLLTATFQLMAGMFDYKARRRFKGRNQNEID